MRGEKQITVICHLSSVVAGTCPLLAGRQRGNVMNEGRKLRIPPK